MEHTSRVLLIEAISARAEEPERPTPADLNRPRPTRRSGSGPGENGLQKDPDLGPTAARLPPTPYRLATLSRYVADED